MTEKEVIHREDVTVGCARAFDEQNKSWTVTLLISRISDEDAAAAVMDWLYEIMDKNGMTHEGPVQVKLSGKGMH
jgi:hypothetical protein